MSPIETENPKLVYPNGQAAFAFMPDGSGFAYYPSGRPAACVSTVSSYQFRFYFYDDSSGKARRPIEGEDAEEAARKAKAQKETLLCALDEHVVGFAVDNSLGPKHGKRLVFTREGALISNSEGTIEAQWKWNSTLQNAGTPPSEPVTLHLNKHLTFTFTDKFTITAQFLCEGASCLFDLGMKLRRMDSYLDRAERVKSGPQFGKLVPQIEHLTLRDRQETFNRSMKAKRNKLNPKSQDLSEKVSHIVADLEKNFDRYAAEHHCTRYLSPRWKEESMAMTMGEVPPIALTGTETGGTRGFGDTMYMSQQDFKAAEEKGEARRMPERLLDPKTGNVLGDVEIRHALKRVNPLLARSRVVNNASGRYCDDIVVPGGKPHPLNPTGKTETLRMAMPTIRAAQLEELVLNGAPPTQLVCCVCVREDDRTSRSVCGAAEVAHGMLMKGLACSIANLPDIEYDPLTADMRIVRVDMAESRTMAAKYGIKTTPFVIMFLGGQVVYAGTMGGKALKVGTSARPWKLLLVEPDFESQRRSESMLRKQGKAVTWDLCMTANEAVSYKQRMQATKMSRDKGDGEADDEGLSYDALLISDKLPDQDVAMLERMFKSGRPGSGAGPLFVGLATMKGDDASYKKLAEATWSSDRMYSADTHILLPERLSAAADIAVTKPMKALQFKALDKILRHRIIQAGGIDKSDQMFIGMTPKSFLRAMRKALEDAKHRGISSNLTLDQMPSSDLGRTLSSQETKFMGVTLQKNGGIAPQTT